jgi:hypothetical protein
MEYKGDNIGEAFLVGKTRRLLSSHSYYFDFFRLHRIINVFYTDPRSLCLSTQFLLHFYTSPTPKNRFFFFESPAKLTFVVADEETPSNSNLWQRIQKLRDENLDSKTRFILKEKEGRKAGEKSLRASAFDAA